MYKKRTKRRILFLHVCVIVWENSVVPVHSFFLVHLNEFDVLFEHFLDSLIPVVVFDARWRGELQIFVFSCFIIIIFVAVDHVNKQTLRIRLSELLIFVSTEILCFTQDWFIISPVLCTFFSFCWFSGFTLKHFRLLTLIWFFIV